MDLQLDPVVSVSSYSALFPPPDGVISADSPTASGRSSYAKTKGYADRVARRPGRRRADCGDVSVERCRAGVSRHLASRSGVGLPIVRWRIAPTVRGGMQDDRVRDVAEVHLRVMQWSAAGPGGMSAAANWRPSMR